VRAGSPPAGGSRDACELSVAAWGWPRWRENARLKEVLHRRGLNGFKETFATRVPAGRFGTGEEIGHAVAFLASTEASYINGANLIIDGGLAIA
jgi:NAD(P)-dependent dehydrogenase (short-subunit alcohol dehydrogenase family)